MIRGTRATATAALVLLSGCVLPVGARHTGRPMRAAAEIVPGTTTRDELLRLVGPPIATAARGEYVSVPTASPDAVDSSYVQQADAWFEPFAARGHLRPEHRVYYWYSREDAGTRVLVPLLLVFVSTESSASSMEELWVLVDERTGTVVDLVRR